MAAKTERLDRLEKVIQILAEDQISLQKLIAELATETRRGFDRVQEQFKETDRRMRETDGRIDKLVSAIGEFIRQRNPGS
jgi:predicted  nucleic acid-binding Zn-ribbon protein